MKTTVKEIQEAEKVLKSIMEMAELLGIKKSKAIYFGMNGTFEITGVNLREMFGMRVEQIKSDNENWFTVLKIIEENPGISPLEITVKTGFNKNSVKSWLVRMVNKGLIHSLGGKYFTNAKEMEVSK